MKIDIETLLIGLKQLASSNEFGTLISNVSDVQSGIHDVHDRQHDVTSIADHAPAALADHGKYLRANPDTGNIEFSSSTATVNNITDIIFRSHSDLQSLVSSDDHTQYHNDTRALTWLGTRSTADLPEGSRLYYTTARFNTDLATKSTSNLTEGSNLYYTTARFNTDFASKTTTDLTEGNNLYYTTARFNTGFAGKSTSDLSEGTNKYYTETKVTNNVTVQSGVIDVHNRSHEVDSINDHAAAAPTNYGKFLRANPSTGAIEFSAQSGGTPTNITEIATRSHSDLQNLSADDHTQYHTDARAQTWLGALASGVLSHNHLANLDNDDHTQYLTEIRALTWLGTRSTTDLLEGINKYYTEARVSANTTVQSGISNVHARTHEIDSVADHQAAVVANYGRFIRANATTGTIEFAALDTAISTLTSGVLNHQNLAGLSNDDHTQYLNDTRGKTWLREMPSGVINHNTLSGLDRDDHTQYLTEPRALTWIGTRSTTDLVEGINQYYTEARVTANTTVQSGIIQVHNRAHEIDSIADHIAASAANLGRFVRANVSTGNIEFAALDTSISALQSGVLNHQNLAGLSNDDHTQYLTESRALTWLGTRSTTDLAEGSKLYYTEARVSANTTVQSGIIEVHNRAHEIDSTADHLPAATANKGKMIRSNASTGNIEYFSLGVTDLPAHASTHKSGGSDSIKLDELAAPTDVTTLNASSTAHGLLPKLSNDTSTFLRGDGTWISPGASSTNIVQFELDVGSVPIYEGEYLIADSGVSLTSQIIGYIAYEAPAGKDLDELEFDCIDLKFQPTDSGFFRLYFKVLDDGVVVDKFKFNYLVG